MRRYAALVIGITLTICALIFYYFSVLRIDYYKTALLNLDPHPDADEYFAQARALATTGTPFIQIGYDRLPSRYPPGYPALMVPWFKLLPVHEQILAPFRTNESIGALLLVGVFALYWWQKKPLDGGLAVLLLGTLPAFVSFSRSCLSEISAATAVALAFALIYLGLQDGKRWLIYSAAAILGLAINIRMQLVFFAPLLLAMALVPNRHSRWTWLLHCFGALLVFSVAASPLLALNDMEFGAPLRTGYDFWVPSASGARSLFSRENIPANLGMLWKEIAVRQEEFRVANLFGTGTYFVASFVVLVIAGIAMMPRDRFFLCALLASATFFAATITYHFVDGRFYLPLLVLSVGAAQLPMGWAVRRAPDGKREIVVAVVIILFILTFLGYPSQSGYRPKPNRLQIWDALQFATTRNRSPNFEAAQSLLRSCANKPGIVLSDIDPVYLNALLGDSFVAAPLDGKHHYTYSATWHYGQPEAVALIHRALARCLDVYGLFASTKDLDQNLARLPSLEGYVWIQLPHPKTADVIMKLTPLPGF